MKRGRKVPTLDGKGFKDVWNCTAYLGNHEITRPNVSYHHCRDCCKTHEFETRQEEEGTYRRRIIEKHERVFTPDAIVRVH